MMRVILISILTALFLSSCGGKIQSDYELKSENKFPVHKSEEEWKAELTANQYKVLREAATEPRHSSSIITLTDKGYMACAACGNLLFHSDYKYSTTSAWPSFDRAIEGSVVYDIDYKIGYARTEVLCAQCGSHLGHVFGDGPRETTGQRYCINGIVLDFVPETDGMH